MSSTQGLPATRRFVLILIIAVLATSFVTVAVGYVALSQRLTNLQSEVTSVRTTCSQQYQVIPTNVSLSELYENLQDSVVMIHGVVAQETPWGLQILDAIGSGFVYDFNTRMVIVTNAHVVDGVSDITVTFLNGNEYEATVLGSDAYYDLAVLSVTAPAGEFKPLQIANSSTLRVGDPVLVIGNPFGLTGSMTTGIVSQLGRTITESAAGGFAIANIIQTSAPINAGNSGGPLLNDRGQVVGVTTAVVSGSEGVGFAIPSNSILRAMASLVNTGSYNQHPWLGISGMDMNYAIAQRIDSNATYGVLITQLTSGGPAEKAGLRAGSEQVQIGGTMVTIGGDVIIAINGVRIVNSDDLSAYLEESTTPNQTINITIVRNGSTVNVSVVLGTRPPPS